MDTPVPPPPPGPPAPGPAPAGPTPDELHRLAVERRAYRQGRGPQPEPGGWTAPDRPAVGGADPGAGTWRSPGYRPSRLRSRAAMGLLAAGVVADAIAVLLGLQGAGLMTAAEAGTLSQAEAEAFDLQYAVVGIVQAILYLASAVAVLAWLSRVVDNVPPLTGATPRRGPRQAIGWWFVPLANLVVPYQIVSDTVRRLRAGEPARGDRVLLPWWLTWVVGTWLGGVIVRLPQETVDEIRQTFLVGALADTLTVVAGALLIVIIRSVERHSEARARGLGLGPAPEPAWPQLGATEAAVPGGPVLAPRTVPQGVAADAVGPLRPPPPPGS